MKRVWPFLLLPLLASCDSVAGPVERVRPAALVFYSDTAVIQVPDTVDHGVPFTVSAQSFGGGCDGPGPTETEARGDTLLVLPYDVTTTAKGLACPDILKFFEHQATLTFTDPGAATVTVRGRKVPGNSPLAFSLPVWVR